MNPTHRWIAQIAFLCALLHLTGLKARAQTYVFGNASYSAPGLSSTSPPQGNAAFVSTDFNGDGISDVAILGPASRDHSIMEPCVEGDARMY